MPSQQLSFSGSLTALMCQLFIASIEAQIGRAVEDLYPFHAFVLGAGAVDPEQAHGRRRAGRPGGCRGRRSRVPRLRSAGDRATASSSIAARPGARARIGPLWPTRPLGTEAASECGRTTSPSAPADRHRPPVDHSRLDVEVGGGLEAVLDLLAALEQDVDPVAARNQRQRVDPALDPRPRPARAHRPAPRARCRASSIGWPRLLRIVSWHSIIGSTSVTSTSILAGRPPTTTSASPLSAS